MGATEKRILFADGEDTAVFMDRLLARGVIEAQVGMPALEQAAVDEVTRSQATLKVISVR